MIRELHLNNFKKHADRSFHFTEGLNGIFGPNYTGKTTILYGILYALGGASQVPGTNLQTTGTNSGMCVKMVMDIGGLRYVIDRKKTGAYLHRYLLDPITGDPMNEQLLASGTSNVNAKVQELIGMPIKRFRQLKYAEQKRAHALLTLGATELHKIIEELKGIDQINIALTKLKDIVSESKGALDVLEFTDPEPLRSKEEELAVEKTELEGELEDAVGSCNRITTRWQDLSAQLTVMREAQKTVQAEKERVSEMSAKLEIRQSDLANLKREMEPKEVVIRYRDRQEEVKDLISSLQTGLSKSRGLHKNKKMLEWKSDKCSEFIAKTAKIIKDEAEQAESIPADIADQYAKQVELVDGMRTRYATEEADYSSKLRMFNDSFCPTCKREYLDCDSHLSEDDLDELRVALESLQKEFKQEEGKLADLRVFVSARKEAMANLKSNQEALESETEDLNEYQEEVSKIQSQLKGLATQEDMEVEIKALQQEDRGLQRSMDQAQEREIKKEQLQSTINRLEESLANRPATPPFDQEELDTLEEKVEKAREKGDGWKVEADRIQELLAEVNLSLTVTRKELSIIEDRNKNFEAAKKKHGTATTLKKFLTDNRDRYTGEVWRFFMGTASTFVNACTSGNITEIERTDDGKFKFIEDGAQMDIKDASGAQESIMGLAVQLALAESAQCPLDILLVDEPTADMDADHSMAVAGVLSTKGSQIIAISHREMDASLCQNVINL